MRPGVTAVIPSIPPRTATHLPRALASVMRQTRAVDAVSVHVDHDRLGSAVNRTRALEQVRTEWSALLDDDDEWLPDHVALLWRHAQETQADLVYPWFTVPGGFDPWPHREGQPFDREALRSENYIPITVLVRTELLLDAGGFTSKDPTNPDTLTDDWGTWERLLDAGARFEHLSRRTWVWHWHGANTSGMPNRW